MTYCPHLSLKNIWKLKKIKDLFTTVDPRGEDCSKLMKHTSWTCSLKNLKSNTWKVETKLEIYVIQNQRWTIRTEKSWFSFYKNELQSYILPTASKEKLCSKHNPDITNKDVAFCPNLNRKHWGNWSKMRSTPSLNAFFSCLSLSVDQNWNRNNMQARIRGLDPGDIPTGRSTRFIVDEFNNNTAKTKSLQIILV